MDEESIIRVYNERAILKNMKHPCILEVFNYYNDEDYIIFVMEKKAYSDVRFWFNQFNKGTDEESAKKIVY